MHTCDFTHKNLKGHMLLMSPRVSGMYKDWFLLMHLCNHFGNPHVFHRPAILSTQGICPPRKHYVTFFSPQGRSQHIHSVSIGQGKKTDVDPCEISGPKESVFKFKWLYEFSWLMYISTNNHMKCKTCLDAYGCSAKPSQSYVQGATNFQRSALDHHQLGNKSLSQPL